MRTDYKYFYGKMCRFVLRNRKNIFNVKVKKNHDSKKTCFWITPWLGTPVPFYAFALALLLRIYKRDEIILVFNDLMGESKLYPSYKDATVYLKKLSKMASLINSIKIIRLSETGSNELTDEENTMLEYMARQNAIKYLHCSEENNKYKSICREWYKELKTPAERIKSILTNHLIDCVVLPGGIFQETGIIVRMCERLGIDYYTYDCDVNNILTSVNGIASQKRDVQKIYKDIIENGRGDSFLRKSLEVMENRKNARKEKDGQEFQICPYHETGKIKHDITIFANIEDDTAALGTHIFYESDSQWLERTIDFIINETDYTIALREHPMLRMGGNERALQQIKVKYNNCERFRFISCREEVNSYQLINESGVIIVNTSTIGLESAMMGKRIVTESESYYSDASFVTKCYTEKEYFDSLIKEVERKKALSPEEIKEASIYYGLAQLCSGGKSYFTTQNKDFDVWIKKDFKSIVNNGETKLYIKSLLEKKALAKIKYEKQYK